MENLEQIWRFFLFRITLKNILKICTFHQNSVQIFFNRSVGYIHFYVQWDLIFLLAYSLISGEYFWYLQLVSKVICHNYGELWSEKSAKIEEKSEIDLPKSILELFLCTFFQFPSIFSFLRVVLYDLIFLTAVFLDIRRVFLIPSACVESVFHNSVALWSEKNWQKKWRNE